MRALRFHKIGTLSDARVEDVPKPAPGPGEVLVRVRAAAVNPSDVKNVLGGFPQTTLPRTPGRDFAGVVEAGASEWVGREVFGTGGGLGFNSGAFRPPAVETCPLTESPGAYAQL